MDFHISCWWLRSSCYDMIKIISIDIMKNFLQSIIHIKKGVHKKLCHQSSPTTIFINRTYTYTWYCYWICIQSEFMYHTSPRITSINELRFKSYFIVYMLYTTRWSQVERRIFRGENSTQREKTCIYVLNYRCWGCSTIELVLSGDF